MTEPDQGRKETDALLQRMEKKIRGQYARAARELTAKLERHLKRFAAADKMMLSRLDAGEITDAEYFRWRTSQIMTGRRWELMRDQLATDLVHADRLAASVINGYMPEVYALNHNYGTYEIEHDSQMSTSYTLYNRQAVERLLRNDPDLLPAPSVDIPKDMQWNRQHIQSSVLQGLLQGESMDKIARRMRDVCGMDARAAIRNARTATTGAENAGKLDSMRRAKGLGVELKKLWLATRDSRTRDSHVLLDGEMVDVEEKFSNGCMYPGDPDGAPAEVYNCRCAMRSKVAGADPYSPDLSRNQRLGGMSYEEWKQQARERIEAKEFKEAISSLRSKGFANLSDDELNRAENLASKEFDRNYKKFSGDLDEKIRAAEEERHKFYQASYKKNQGDPSVKEEWERLSKKVEELQSSKAAAQAKALAETISKIRPVGIPKEGKKLLAEHFKDTDKQLIKRITNAYKFFPSDWVMHSLRFGKMRVLWDDSSYYDNERFEIGFAKGSNEDRLFADAIHELGHRFEQVIPGFLDVEKSYYNKRTKGCPKEKLYDLDPDYFTEEDGYTRKDNFLEYYIGRDYGGSAFELLSNGLEYAYTNPTHLAEDMDMQRWIRNLLFFG